MIEDEAKQKWCPFARVAARPKPGLFGLVRWAIAFNRYADAKPIGSHCIGSACMAWRWKLSPDEAARKGTRRMEYINEDGYCGLAGQP